MPELPEVETTCRGLAPVLLHHSIEKVMIHNPNLRIPIPDYFKPTVEHATVKKLYRRAKYICIDLDNNQTILIHLGMSGRMVINPSHNTPEAKHDHVIFQISNNQEIIFNDARRFGLITITKTNTLNQHPLLAKLGVEPLSADFNGTYIFDKTRKKTKPIKHWLMDASNVVGVGNIYACESLFKSHISPTLPVSELTKTQCNSLSDSVRHILEQAILAGGSSLKDYVQSSGEMGYFQHHFSVYGKEGQPCENCKTPITRIKQSGRSTFLCAICQP